MRPLSPGKPELVIPGLIGQSDRVDNITHTLIGLIAGESAASETRPSGLAPASRRTLLVTIAVIGSNSPDLDLLVSFGDRGNLGYALWHRGYTHTVLGCLVLGLFLYAGAEACMRLRRLRPSRRDRGVLLAVALVTTALHLGMDYLNSYGVHPFWPADDRWRYGDSVFIVEPLYWVSAAPLLFWLRTRLTRALFGFALAAVVVLGAITRLLTLTTCTLLVASAAVLALGGARLAERGAARLAATLSLAVTLAFVLAGHGAASRAAAWAQSNFPGDRLLDRILTPMPANPFCWDLLLIERGAGRYVARHATLALMPRVQSARACPSMDPERHTAPLRTVAASDSDAIEWLGEYDIPLASFVDHINASCRARAFMRFDRAPFLAESPSGATVLGDLRFDRGRERGSFEIALDTPSRDRLNNLQNCMQAAPWAAPRADLLSR
jgi:inner membrane protein